jgi:hypothetical protein
MAEEEQLTKLKIDATGTTDPTTLKKIIDDAVAYGEKGIEVFPILIHVRM